MSRPIEPPDQTAAERAYFFQLGSVNCDHPPRFRHPPFDDGRPATMDPKEWRCGVCGTLQLRYPLLHPVLRARVTDGEMG